MCIRDSPKTSLFFGTAYGFTATVPGIDDASEAALNRDVPKGYTTLQTYEKRAVVAPDGVLRIWPRAYDSPAQEFRLIVPAAGNQRYLDLGATPGIRFAVLDAVNLAARVGQPVLVARLLSSRPLALRGPPGLTHPGACGSPSSTATDV